MPSLFLVQSFSSYSEQMNSSFPLTSHADEINTDGQEEVCVFVYVLAAVLNAAMEMFVTPDCTLQLKLRSSHNEQDAS